jgi:23S rRNA-/tRNA-specific pseudouridylate synthase
MLAALVAAAADVSEQDARALINLGAVYCGSSLAPERATAAGAHVAGGAYLRVHARPRRFPAAQATDWRARVLHREHGLVIVDKPSGLPVGPGVDNTRDCVSACVSAALRCAPLRVVHRLDNCTSGVVALAETKEAAARFGVLQRAAAEATDDDAAPVVKLYRALTRSPVAVGTHACYVETGHKQPAAPRKTLVFDAPGPNRQACSQTVLECAPHGPDAFEVLVRLRTGKTHQIRALLAHYGAPLVGDSLYGPSDRGCREPDTVALHAWRLELAWTGDERRAHSSPPPWWPALP